METKRGFSVVFGLCVSAIHVGLRQRLGGEAVAIIALVYEEDGDRQLALKVAKELDALGGELQVDIMRYDGQEVGTTRGVPYVVVTFEVRPASASFLEDLGVPSPAAVAAAGQLNPYLLMMAEADFPDGLRPEFLVAYRKHGHFNVEIVEPLAEVEEEELLMCRPLWSRRMTVLTDCANAQ